MSLPNPAEQPTMAATEVAEVWGCSAWAVYEMVRSQTCPVEPLRLGRKLRWPTARVLASVGLDGSDGRAATYQPADSKLVTP